jgi:transcriptional regulator with XRE-family HTH domain
MTPATDDDPPGVRLRKRRLTCTLSQQDVAEAAGITRMRLNEIEMRWGRPPTAEEISRIEIAIDNLP